MAEETKRMMKNNEKITKAILIIAIGAMVVWLFLQLTLSRYLSSALLMKLVPFMQEFEGGLSRDPNDSASANPAPWSYNGQSGWHTNKGVTYLAFKTKAPLAGYQANAKNFFEMPDDLWMKILELGYMSAFDLDQIDHLPRIQAVIISWAWGSGVGGASSRLASFIREEMNVNDSDITREEIIKYFKQKINRANELFWFNKLCDRREADFKKMPTCPAHCNGWLRRLNSFRQLFS